MEGCERGRSFLAVVRRAHDDRRRRGCFAQGFEA
jgi:hypothetical protein